MMSGGKNKLIWSSTDRLHQRARLPTDRLRFWNCLPLPWNPLLCFIWIQGAGGGESFQHLGGSGLVWVVTHVVIPARDPQEDSFERKAEQQASTLIPVGGGFLHQLSSRPAISNGRRISQSLLRRLLLGLFRDTLKELHGDVIGRVSYLEQLVYRHVESVNAQCQCQLFDRCHSLFTGTQKGCSFRLDTIHLRSCRPFPPWDLRPLTGPVSSWTLLQPLEDGAPRKSDLNPSPCC